MSTFQTWATSSQFRHPWLEPTSIKRKSQDIDPDPPPPKRRRRYTNIEDGLASLSLSGNLNAHPYYPNYATSFVSVEEIPPEVAMETDTSFSSYSTQPAYTVEEPAIPEINMKTSSWFEPEPDRIVITDLDSFTQSDDEEEQQSLAVNTTLLEKIRANVADKFSGPAPSSVSQALVLYTTPFWPSTVNEQARREELKKPCKADNVRLDEEGMAMDVEQ